MQQAYLQKQNREPISLLNEHSSSGSGSLLHWSPASKPCGMPPSQILIPGPNGEISCWQKSPSGVDVGTQVSMRQQVWPHVESSRTWICAQALGDCGENSCSEPSRTGPCSPGAQRQGLTQSPSSPAGLPGSWGSRAGRRLRTGSVLCLRPRCALLTALAEVEAHAGGQGDLKHRASTGRTAGAGTSPTARDAPNVK